MSNRRSFLTRLRRVSKAVHDAAPDETRTLSLNANFGQYKIVLGPEYSPRECRERHVPIHSRPIEIVANIDHLFVHQTHVSPMPDQGEVNHQLKETVVIHGVKVHIFDADGEGTTVRIEPGHPQDVRIDEEINLAGPEASRTLGEMKESGRLAQEAYRIIQQDVIRSLLQQRKISY